MLHNNSIDPADVVNLARALHNEYDSDARRKLAVALCWMLALLGASVALSFVTGGILTRLMPLRLAYLVGTIIHLAIGLAVHLLMLGIAERYLRDKVMGAIFIAFSLGALAFVCAVRIIVLTEEGRTRAFAWTISGFLFTIEVVIPALLGYFLAKAWLESKRAAEVASFYRKFKQMIEISPQPAQHWNDAEDRLADEVAEAQHRIHIVEHKERVKIEAEREKLRRLLYTLREWNPTREWKPTQDTLIDARAMSLTGGDGQGDPNTIQKPLPPVHAQPSKRDDATFKG